MQLHLNPLNAIVQLRPSMKYLDESDTSSKKPSVSADLDEKMGEPDGETPDESADLVAMQVTTLNTEVLARRKLLCSVF